MTLNISPPAEAGGQLGRVLVIDDDAAMRQTICTYLERHQCPTVGLSDPASVIQQIESGAFSMVLLDLQLGQKDGLDILRQIRERSDIPVIIITGERQDDIDRIVGLELGADDYLTKPFHLRELLARARATLRRQEMGRLASGNPRQRGGYRFNGWEVRCKTRSLFDPEGNPVTLTKGEYALLIAFLEAPRRTLSREQLLRGTRTHEDIYDRTIDVQVLRLRRKLEHDPTQPQVIRTERGVGYIFDSNVERLF
ncbi:MULTISPECIES: response regulator [unclassified Sphingobium]|uniref:response regulator n=1 Tax=unclassified Sphingobium TaxID=2611147 RepID=UPI0035A584D2